jgi:ABC-2 type transport system permease protein
LRQLSRLKTILEKDFLDSIRNRTVFFAILFPILLSILFRVVLSPSELPKLKLAVVNDYGSGFPNFLSRSTLGIIDVSKIEDVEKAKKIVKDGDALAAIILPEGFDKKMENGETPLVDFWVDGNNMVRASVIEMMVNRMLYHYNKKAPPAELVINNVRGMTFSPRTAMLPTWILFTILGGFTVVASSIIEERERKTLQAILVTPCRLPDVLIGKGLVSFILTLTGSILILALNGGLVGNFYANIAIIAAGIAFFTFLGIFLGLCLPGQSTANAFGSIVFMAMFLPVILSPVSKKMKMVASLLPSYYIDDGIQQAMFSKVGMMTLLPHFIYLILAGLVLFIASIIVLKKKENL